jgi:hypothetical protein
MTKARHCGSRMSIPPARPLRRESRIPGPLQHRYLPPACASDTAEVAVPSGTRWHCDGHVGCSDRDLGHATARRDLRDALAPARSPAGTNIRPPSEAANSLPSAAMAPHAARYGRKSSVPARSSRRDSDPAGNLAGAWNGSWNVDDGPGRRRRRRPGTLGDVTHSSRMTGHGRLRRGMVCGMARRIIPAQRVLSVRLSVSSVQLARAEHGAVLLIIRRPWVRVPPAPPAVSSTSRGKAVDRFVDRRRRRDVSCRHALPVT